MQNSTVRKEEYQPNDRYVGHMPSPPRINVPPPNWPPAQFQPVEGGPGFDFDKSSFLHGFDWATFVNPPDLFDWRYENRRQAQQILPFLYLGPMTSGRDKEFLKEEHITMVLAVRQERTVTAKALSGALRTAAELGLQTKTLDVVDNQGLIACFPNATQIINQHLSARKVLADTEGDPSAQGRVLIYCESGNERSAAVVVAYIMEVFNCGLVDAILAVHQHRFCINIDDPMKHILLTYEDILRARRDVAGATGSNLRDVTVLSESNNPLTTMPPAVNASKRSHEYDSDDDADIDDIARFHDRTFKPFSDMSS